MSQARKLLVILVLAIAALAMMPMTSADAAPADDEAAYLRDINNLRASKGLGALRTNAALNTMARNWANQMAAANKISHNPNMAKLGPAGWTILGENVGVGGSEASVFGAFVASPGHYANLVNPKFNQVGIAVVYANGRQWTVHNFMGSPNFDGGTPAAAAAPRAAAPAESDAARYMRTLAERMPAAGRTQTLRSRTALGL